MSLTPPRGSPRTGRRPGDQGTRERIVREARQLFAQQGFRETTLRQIAVAAGVDVALIGHYFGSKQGLFAELTRLPFDPQAAVAELTAPGLDGLGERLVQYLMNTIRDESQHQQSLVTLLRSSGGHTEVGAAVKKQYVKELLEPLARDIQADQPELRAALCSAQLLGLSFAEQVLELEGLKTTSTEQLVRVVGATLQRYLTGPL